MPRPVIPIATAKRHLRVEHDLDDASIQLYLSAAIDRTLQEVGLAGELDDEREATFSGQSARIDLPVAAVPSVTRDGVALAGADWTFTGNAERGYTITITDAAHADDAEYLVTYSPGWASPPDWFTLAVLFLTAHYYENRSSVVTGQGIVTMEVPQGFSHLCRPHRRFHFV